MARVNGTHLVVFACLGLIGVCAAIGWYEALDRNLSEPPRREAGPPVPRVPVSQMALNVTLPFTRLAAAAEADMPQTFAGNADGPDVCAKIGIKLCAGTRYDYNAVRGPLSISEGPENSIRISMPLKLTGHGGFRGDGARLLHLEAKRFEASTDAHADVRLGLTREWCPAVQVRVDPGNLDARVEIVGHTWVSVSSLIEKSVREELQKAGERAAAALKCEDVRGAVQAVWVSRSFPLPLPADSRSLHVNFEPLTVGFSGVHVTPTAAHLMLSLGARVSVSDTVLDAPQRPLPAWQPVPLRQGALQLAVPLRVSYGGIQSHLESLAGRQVTMSTPAGEATLVADQFVVYPAGERVAVGAHIRAQLPGQFLTTRGWLYVTARPVVSPDGRAVRLADITYSRILDSQLAGMLTVMMDGQIRDQLVTAGQFDLSPTIAKAKELLRKGLAQHSSQVAVEMGDPDLRLGRIIPGAGALFIEGLFTSGADLTLLGAR